MKGMFRGGPRVSLNHLSNCHLQLRVHASSCHEVYAGKPAQAEYQALAALLFIDLPAHMLEAPDEEALNPW